ncbi:MAG: alpha/beta fold hydrolase [Moraxellaceae bacterium]|nr:alpha/beta fold hydrolase [Moraxellaceae bacterium]MDZ4385732.1 alpha/beta fold hydrolase [Moraxellaceae bacterium]
MSNVKTLINDWRAKGQPLKVHGANSYIWRTGQGEPVVCIHGVPASGFLYRKLLPELAKQGLEGVTLDLPGLGLADRPNNFDYSWSGLSAWYLSALDAADINRFHLVVHDIGGPIGFDLIRRVPHRIMSLTVLNTMVDVSTFSKPWSMAPFSWPVLGRIWLQSARTPLFYFLMKLQGMHRISRDEAAAYGQLLLGSDQGRAFQQIMRAFEKTPAFELAIKAALTERAFPAQLIWGMDDPALKAKVFAPKLQKALGLKTYQLVKGKHFLQEDSYVEIAESVAKLIKS